MWERGKTREVLQKVSAVQAQRIGKRSVRFYAMRGRNVVRAQMISVAVMLLADLLKSFNQKIIGLCQRKKFS